MDGLLKQNYMWPSAVYKVVQCWLLTSHFGPSLSCWVSASGVFAYIYCKPAKFIKPSIFANKYQGNYVFAYG